MEGARVLSAQCSGGGWERPRSVRTPPHSPALIRRYAALNSQPSTNNSQKSRWVHTPLSASFAPVPSTRLWAARQVMIQRALQTSGWWHLPGGNLVCGDDCCCFGTPCKRVVLLGFVLLCLVLTGCKDKAPLRIGLNPWPGYQFLHLAEERGYFADEGVNVRLLQFGSLGDTRRAFERRQLDGMCCTLSEVLATYRHSDRKPKVVLVIDYSDGADVIVAREPINRVEDLRGQVVAAQPGTVDNFFVTRALQKAGLPLDAVKLHPMASPNMPMAFARGEIAAAVTYAPLADELLKQPGAKVIFTSKAIPREIVDVLAVGTTVPSSRHADLVGIGRALDRAIQFTEEHPEEACRIMARHSGATPETFAAGLDGVRMVRSREQSVYFTRGGILEKSIDETAVALRATGLITGPVQSSAMVVDLDNQASK